jgi:hypothetical protein
LSTDDVDVDAEQGVLPRRSVEDVDSSESPRASRAALTRSASIRSTRSGIVNAGAAISGFSRRNRIELVEVLVVAQADGFALDLEIPPVFDCLLV